VLIKSVAIIVLRYIKIIFASETILFCSGDSCIFKYLLKLIKILMMKDDIIIIVLDLEHFKWLFLYNCVNFMVFNFYMFVLWYIYYYFFTCTITFYLNITVTISHEFLFHYNISQITTSFEKYLFLTFKNIY